MLPISSQHETPLLLFLLLMKPYLSFKTQFKFLKVHNLFPDSATPLKKSFFLFFCLFPLFICPTSIILYFNGERVSSFEDTVVQYCGCFQSLNTNLRKTCTLHSENVIIGFAEIGPERFRSLLLLGV